jgi:ribosomal protein S18 acetylase RimI-like enzyme
MDMRVATASDLPSIVAMLADDALGQGREDPSQPPAATYAAAFAAIDADPNQQLVVAVEGEDVIGCLQLSFIPGLSRQGMWRGQIESVRVAAPSRARGLGREMLDWAIERCRERGCGLVQLTTDKSREDAVAFYASLGFKASHEGMKLDL